MSTNNRIRGRALQRIRMYEFMNSPYCSRCGEPILLMSEMELDHRQPVGQGGPDVHENRQVMHIACHKEKTNEDMGYKQRPKIGLDGYPE